MIHTLRTSVLAAVVLYAAGCGAPAEEAPKAPAQPSSSAGAGPKPTSTWTGSSPWALPIEARRADTALGQLRLEAKDAEPLVTTAFAKRFLAATEKLPPVKTRKLYHTKDKKRFYSQKEHDGLDAAAKAELTMIEIDEEIYYNTKFGSPISYVRALDLLAKDKLIPEQNGKVLDFGYGYIGHLKLLATLGYDTTGVDVDPMLRALYSEPGDQGPMAGPGGGAVRLLDGRYPADAPIAKAVGSGYDLVISKNVLKKGYIHPDRFVEKHRMIDLGVDDATFLKTIHDALKPKGVMMIYNVCPALTPPDKPLVPYSDGRSPFTEEQWKAAGFTVLAYNRDDKPTIQKLGHALSWDKGEGAMDLVNDLSVIYTLVQRD